MAISKLERLMNLLAALLNTTVPLSVDALARRVEGYEGDGASFRRQFERDKDALRAMGVPISVLPVPGEHPPVDGYRVLASEYYLPDPGFTPDELAALHLASRLVQVDRTAARTGLWKLGGVPEPGAEPDGPNVPLASLPSDPNLAAAFAAAARGTTVRFGYRGEPRRLASVRLRHTRGHWYLSGIDLDVGEARLFRLDRVDGTLEVDTAEETAVHGAPIEPDRGGTLDPWRIGDAEPIWARVAVDRAAAAEVVHQVGAERVVEVSDDGELIIELEVTNPDGFRSWLLGLLDHAQVLEPPELVASVIDWVVDLAEPADLDDVPADPDDGVA